MNSNASVNNRPAKGADSRGFTLLEVLIAVFVLAIGVLGLAALQITSKQAGAEAAQRTMAANLAFDLLERMRLSARAVPPPLGYYVSLGASLSTINDLYNQSTIFDVATVDCAVASCTPDELAAFDLFSVLSAASGAHETRSGNLVGGLNTPTLCVTGPNGGGAGTYGVTIAWRGKSGLTDIHAANSCGNGRTGEDQYGAGLKYRRILTVSTFIPNA